mgnify:CR=1 FL=1
MKAVVIIPTTGDKKVLQAIKSVENQTYKDTSYLLVVDGNKFKPRFDDLFVNSEPYVTPKDVVYLKQNTGGGGFYGHRVYAGFSHLVNEDIVLFLYQDNWFEPEHVENLIKTIQDQNLAWAFSLRNIYDKDDNFLCRDDCENLGKYPVWNGMHYHVDTSAYAFRRDFLIRVASVWHSGYAGDRRFFNSIKDIAPFDTSGVYTLNYRLDGNATSASPEFFIHGNKMNHQKYEGKFPWKKET